MPRYVHAKATEVVGLQFRIWSSISDSYISEEMTEEELREWALKEAVCEAVKRYNREIDQRIQRAREKGTSSLMGDKRDLSGPWDKERE